MVRLVKGAYWDTEIKRAQVEGLDGFPVFTRKAATDVSTSPTRASCSA
jgi:RHH-type proline utilization regulon transcriptional repressor/proline dehydrogenase/delta 1-pyrroline-5-carboxylate dehydrogenase